VQCLFTVSATRQSVVPKFQTGLTSVVIPDSVTSIGHFAFDSCTSLASVEVPPTAIVNFNSFGNYNGVVVRR
jgi:hypothetical protein